MSSESEMVVQALLDAIEPALENAKYHGGREPILPMFADQRRKRNIRRVGDRIHCKVNSGHYEIVVRALDDMPREPVIT